MLFLNFALQTVFLLSTLDFASAFSLPRLAFCRKADLITRHVSSSISSSELGFAFDDDDEEEEDEDNEALLAEARTTPNASLKLQNDFFQFLNQCTIQSFLFLLQSMRDPHTVMWVEQYTQPCIELSKAEKSEQQQQSQTGGGIAAHSKLLRYHGLHAMNTTAFATWDVYFSTLLKLPTVSYIIESDLKHIPDYELEIAPARLCTRMISVREQIAREFARDLSVIARMSNADEWFESVSSSNNQAANLLFLELNADEASDYAPSPLRRGNFDLLQLLVTQESIHRTILHLQDEASAQYLAQFYADRLNSHFVGSQAYGKADAFLTALATSATSVPRSATIAVSSSKSSTAKNDETQTTAVPTVDPVALTEQVLLQRQQVALEWKGLAEEVPDVHHVEIKKLQLNALLASYNNAPGVITSTTPTDSSSSGSNGTATTTTLVDDELHFQ